MGLIRRREAADDKARERQRRKREKERRRRRTYKYGQTEVKHSRRGILSCTLAFISAFLMVLIFSVSYISRGEVNIFIGLAGIMAFVIAVVGLLRGIEGFRERNKNYASCKVGVVCNGILLLAFAATFIRGLF
ncbi:MAG: DUF6142 family protein [Eubacteriales bacterium]|nr:DUF6142 family protein [Eubacteriales bacterium]